ncbi:hypothetical protein MUK42_27147, partial [Musa troglodytarum]
EGSDQGSEGENGVGRARSLTDDDLEELKACLDLGFGFTYDEIPELCKTLPALVLCYSLSRSLQTSAATVASPSIANWKISGPGVMNLLSSFFPSPAHEGIPSPHVKAGVAFQVASQINALPEVFSSLDKKQTLYKACARVTKRKQMQLAMSLVGGKLAADELQSYIIGIKRQGPWVPEQSPAPFDFHHTGDYCLRPSERTTAGGRCGGEDDEEDDGVRTIIGDGSPSTPETTKQAKDKRYD